MQQRHGCGAALVASLVHRAPPLCVRGPSTLAGPSPRSVRYATPKALILFCQSNLARSSPPRDLFAMLFATSVAFASAAAFSPAVNMAVSAPPARASAPVMSAEPTSRRAALLGLAAAVTPFAASAADVTPIWKTSKTSLGSKSGPPKGSGADKCTVAKPCTTGAGLKWDPAALGVSKGAMKPGGDTPRKFFKTPTYASSPIG